MSKFKAGDKVRFIGITTHSYAIDPTAYDSYEVINCGKTIVNLQYPKLGNIPYHASDFELVSELTSDFKIERPQVALTELAKAAAAYSVKTSIDLDFEDYECWQANWLKGS